MKSVPLLLVPILLFADLGLSAWAGPPGPAPLGVQRRNELRVAVEAHRAATREEVQREEAAAGRRLTPAELAELRSQVREQWAPRQDVVRSAESQPAERIAPLSMSSDRLSTGPRSQRP